jgi:glycosyltransferase involved in cell wall biosynthesis
MSNVSASVIICTHNPQPYYLRRVLEALRKQTLPLDQWELLLIDNASEQPLYSSSWDISWHPHARHIREERLGLCWARLRGMRESSADMLIFVDDDNILAPDYLSEAIRINREWPLLGVWGSGAIVPEFEVEPAEHLREFTGMLALRNIKTALWSNVLSENAATPWGAGQCLRAKVAEAYCAHFEKSAIKITDRVGTGVLGQGDVEICYVACSYGLGVGVFPQLKLTHLIPKERVDEEYLVRLAEGSGASTYVLNYKWQDQPVPSFSRPIDFLALLKNMVVRKGVRRRMYLASIRARRRAQMIISKQENEAVKSEIAAGKSDQLSRRA